MSQERLEPAATESLNLFLEKAEKLQRTTTWKLLAEGGARLSIKADKGNPVGLEIEGPGEEALDAFILTLRFFIQNNEPTSIRNVCELLQSLPIDQSIKERVGVGRERYNSFLDRKCLAQIDGDQPTHRRVQDVFIYGAFAHAHPEKKAVFKSKSSSDRF